jgi:hypothetical protein
MSASMNAGHTVASGCGCPVCRGLQLFESPKYATGALLSAEDLSSEQAFVRAKMRLHNRHLHGWGVVCGLKVVCDDCEGSVRILPGYALDPCGNDIVLAEATRFDVVKAIRDCRDLRRPKLGDCDPFVPAPDPGCRDIETHWCVTLRFKEVESAHAVSLARQAVSPGGCGCGQSPCRCGGGNIAGCGCGRGGTGSGVLSSAPAGMLGYALPGCAPRRLVECFEIGVVERKEPCAPLWRRDPQGDKPQGFAGGLIPADSLLGRILGCGQEAIAILENRLTEADAKALAGFAGAPQPGVTAQAMHDALCRLRQALIDFLMRHDPVHCQMLRSLDDLMVPVPQPPRTGLANAAGESPADYAARASRVAEGLFGVWLQATIDCVCDALLPRCPEDPLDDRVPIACVTVKGDRIISICNHSCRRYAGAFPSLFHWLSLVPVVPLVSKLLATLCCTPVAEMFQLARSTDATGAWRSALAADGFAVPRSLVREAQGLDFGKLAGEFLQPIIDRPPVAAPLGKAPQEAVAALAALGVQAKVEEVADPGGASLATLDAMLRARERGATLLVHQGKVVGMRLDESRPAPATEDMAALRSELATLRARVARLDPGGER